MGHRPPIDHEQPFSGHIEPRQIPRRFMSVRKSRLPEHGINTYQTYLNKMRKRFLILLPHDHALFKRADQSSGQLKQEQPPGADRRVLSETEISAKRRKQLARKRREDPWSHYCLRRRRHTLTWQEGYAKEKGELLKLKANKRETEHETNEFKYEDIARQQKAAWMRMLQLVKDEREKEEKRLAWELFDVSGQSLPIYSPATTSPTALQLLDQSQGNASVLHQGDTGQKG